MKKGLNPYILSAKRQPPLT